MTHILIVDDDPNSAAMLSEFARTEGFSTAQAASLREARQQLVIMPADAILLDLRLPDGSGFELLEDPVLRGHAEVVLITGHASLETSIQALRIGAVDYLTKPTSPAQLKRVFGRLARGHDHKTEIRKLSAGVEPCGRFGSLWGRSDPMLKVYEQLARVAPTMVSVLVVGESGTGKELVAQTLHELSRRRGHPFLAINCGAISPQLIESELFGHEKGSFTGAVRQHRGYFERAHGGTIFLDEITEMPLDLQVKLLRVLETGAFLRVGSDDVFETDVRIVAATNRDPLQAVGEGKLREDLYYRLNVFQVSLPPLRLRKDDIELLTGHFLQTLNETNDSAKRFSPASLAYMQQYDWPGNVRQLRNFVQRAAIMSDGDVIEPSHLPADLFGVTVASGGEAATGSVPALEIRVGSSIADVERELIVATLKHCGGVREKTAEMLGISLKTLYNRLREYGYPQGA